MNILKVMDPDTPWHTKHQDQGHAILLTTKCFRAQTCQSKFS